MKTENTPTADQFREAMAYVNRRGDKLNAEGVDFDALEREVAAQRTPAGWEAPRVLPPQWREVDRNPEGGVTMYQSHHIRVILSCSIEADERAWLHMSISTRDRIPNWNELAHAKRVFLGDREAYQVIPPKARYVNINEKVLHLFALLDENATALPDFTRSTGSI